MRRTLLVIALMLGLVGLSGCISDRPDYYLSTDDEADATAERGSIADLNRRLGMGATPAAPQPMKFLVVHDVAGKPTYVQLQRGSGDPALDLRAQRYLMSEYTFPAGQADTILLTIDPKDVPRE